MKKLFVFLTVILTISCNSEMKNLKTVENVNLDRYLGKWYEIARFPNSFEKGLICTTAEYSLRDDGKIKVVNTGRKEDNLSKVKSSTGKAWFPDKDKTGQLKVQFFWPFSGDYYIFHLDKENYQYALIGEPSRKYLWILSRTPQIDDELYQELLNIAQANDFDISKVYKTPQNCK